jgi:hypothetical protein
MKTSLLLIQLALAAVLMVTCFCRARKTDENTHREVRWAIVFEGVAGGLIFGAPIMPLVMVPGGTRWAPSWPAWSTPVEFWLVLLLAVVLMQLATARHLANGAAPQQLQRTVHARGGIVFAGMLLMVGMASQLAVARTPTQEAALSAPQAIHAPMYHLKQGQSVECNSPEGCFIFTRSALVDEITNFTTKVCGPKYQGTAL